MNYIEYNVRVYESGDKRWYLNGNYHRENGPAIEYANGDKFWYLNGDYHRENGPAAEYADGSKYWYLNGNYHRDDGPAIECANGNKHWYLNGQRHREDGPAVEWANGDKCWYLNGNKLTERQWKKQIVKDTMHNKIVEVDGKKYKLVEQTIWNNLNLKGITKMRLLGIITAITLVVGIGLYMTGNLDGHADFNLTKKGKSKLNQTITEVKDKLDSLKQDQ